MARLELAAKLDDIERANDVRVDIGPRMLEAVADPRLRGEVDHHLGLEVPRSGQHPVGVLQHADVGAKFPQLREFGVSIFLQLDVVVRRHAVDAQHFVPLSQQPLGEMKTDETGSSRDQIAHRQPILLSRYSNARIDPSVTP